MELPPKYAELLDGENVEGWPVFAYLPNRAVLHTDTAVLPTRELAWAAWNYERPAAQGRESANVCLHYLLNLLQPLLDLQQQIGRFADG